MTREVNINKANCQPNNRIVTRYGFVIRNAKVGLPL